MMKSSACLQLSGHFRLSWKQLHLSEESCTVPQDSEYVDNTYFGPERVMVGPTLDYLELQGYEHP